MAIGVLTIQAAKEQVYAIQKCLQGKGTENKKEGRCAVGMHCRGVCLSRNKIAGSGLEVQFHCFLQFPQVNFNVSEQDGSKNLAFCATSKKEQGLPSIGVLNPGLECLSLS